MHSNNVKREKNGLGKNKPKATVKDFEKFLDERSHQEIAPSFKELIEKCVAEKTGKYGGQGNRELEPSSKRDWKLYIGKNLNHWIGHYSSTEKKKILMKAVRDGINKGVETRKGRELGKPWSEISKWKRAKKVSEFAKWCIEHDEEYLKVNFFAALPKKFSPTFETRPSVYEPSIVKRLFEVLASNERYKRMIPYYTLCFFGGLRPSEAAYASNAKRRLNWQVFDEWKRKSEVTKGVKSEVVAKNHLGMRMSKSNIDRTADLPPNGVAWIKFALGELPTDGEVHYDRDIVEAARKEADLWGKDPDGKAKWIDDGARHSATTYANNNTDFKAPTSEYWRDAFGHKDDVFKKHYGGRVDHQSVKTEYFSIMPPALNRTLKELGESKDLTTAEVIDQLKKRHNTNADAVVKKIMDEAVNNPKKFKPLMRKK